MLAVGLGAWLGWSSRRWPAPPGPPPDTVASAVDVRWASPPDFAAGAWDVMQAATPGVTGEDHGPLAQRFRLAGTFFAYAEAGTDDARGTRQAILDDLEEQRQRLIAEGDTLADIEVVRIFRDRVVLRGSGGEEAIWLSFRDRPDAVTDPTAPETTDTGVVLRFEDLPALETHRFGRRIADNRWIMERDELLRYADEVQRDPERMAALLLAMQPDYNVDDEIAGFRLEKLGEDELYVAAGFQDGDVVRRVNSMPMTSPARAQYFISEFMQGRMDAVVLDIERNGEEQKLIHLIR